MSQHQVRYPLQFPQNSFPPWFLLYPSQPPVSRHPYFSVLKPPLDVHQSTGWRWTPGRRLLFRASRTPYWVLPSNRGAYGKIGGPSQKWSAKKNIEMCKSTCIIAMRLKSSGKCYTQFIESSFFHLKFCQFFKNMLIITVTFTIT